MNEARYRRFLFLAAAAAFLLLSEGAITGSDGQSMYQVTRSMVSDGSLEVPQGLGVPGRDGDIYSKYGIGQSLVAIPAYLVALPATAVAGGSADAIAQAAVSVTVPLVSAMLLVALYALGRRLGARPAAATLGAVGALAGTFALPYTKEFFSEPLATLGIVIAIERTVARSPLGAGAGLAVSILARPQSLVLAPVLLLLLARRGGAPAAIRASIPLASGVAATVAYNVARFADATEFGYGAEPGFTTPLITGLRGLILDPAKSLLLFAPIVLVVPAALASLWRRRHGDAAALITANLVATLVMSATWWSWAGGWSWGPRLLLPGVLPAVPAVAAWFDGVVTRRRVAVGLFAAGALLSLPAMLVSTRAQQLDPDPGVGPSITRQYALIPPTASHSLRNARARGDEDHRQHLSLWQIGVVGELGAAGALATLPLTAGVAVVGVWAVGRARRELVVPTPRP